MTEEHTNVADFLLKGKDPDRIALQFVHLEVSYGQLQQRMAQVAKWVLRMGGRKGDRIIIVGKNSPFWVGAYLGIMRAGLVSVPVSTTVSGADLEYVRQATDARIVFAERGFVLREGLKLGSIHLVTDVDVENLPNVLSQREFGAIESEDKADGVTLPSIHSDDLAALMFTSGSTAAPRGVMISHRNITANTESILRFLQLQEQDRIMAVLPFYYCFGTSLLHTHLRVGGALVVDNRFMYPETVLERMIATECTGFAGVPSHFQILLRNSTLSKKQFPHLRYVQQAGGRLVSSDVRNLREALPDTQVFIMYGQTEATARLSYLPPEFLETKPGSIGKGMPGVQLRVLKESGVEVRPGEVGEITATGHNIARGYWGAPDESADSFRDGVLYTGDLATVDEDGFMYIVDRARDVLKCGGERVSARQLEEQMMKFEELLEAAVIGMADDVLGESVKAFVVPRHSIYHGLEDRVRHFCKSHMPPQLVPKEIVVLSELPRNDAGKVLKTRLKELQSVGSI